MSVITQRDIDEALKGLTNPVVHSAHPKAAAAIRQLWHQHVIRQRELAEARAERDDARAKLFPYADATEISGMSWSGFYLIGDKKSIAELRRIENRSAQIEVFRAAFDERAEAAEARATASERQVEAMREALKPFATYLDLAAFDLDNNGQPLPDSEGMGWVYLTVGDFRRARAILNPSEKNNG